MSVVLISKNGVLQKKGLVQFTIPTIAQVPYLDITIVLPYAAVFLYFPFHLTEYEEVITGVKV